eukprot:TRINITY_DN69269_c0_g1_i1.p1 TRINITY_DN69269_c0_g1~~TRINITY_DN69269_c0_g1_i1.p1  ORF type:complete len:130 (+),score=5.64 TRINITY_DN69269_c0_g1_i1:32-421(+)
MRNYLVRASRKLKRNLRLDLVGRTSCTMSSSSVSTVPKKLIHVFSSSPLVCQGCPSSIVFLLLVSGSLAKKPVFDFCSLCLHEGLKDTAMHPVQVCNMCSQWSENVRWFVPFEICKSPTNPDGSYELDK